MSSRAEVRASFERMKSTALSIALSLGGVAAVAAAAFVRPPVSPTPRAIDVANAAPMPMPTSATTPTLTNAQLPDPNASPNDVAPATHARSFAVDVLAVASWGDGPSDLGRTRAPESNPEAPMSLVANAAGEVFVLDQVNARVQVFDAKGKITRSIPIPTHTAQDLALDPRGGIALLDRLVDKAVVFVDATGKETKRVAIVGDGIQEGGAATGLFATNDGFWIEVEHRSMVRVALPNGDPDLARTTIEGRRTIDGGPLLQAARDPSGFAVVSSSGQTPFLVRVPFAEPVVQLEALESDAKGGVYLAAHLGIEQPIAPYTLIDQTVVVVALDAAGSELGRIEFPAPDAEDEQLRPIAIGPDGAVYHLHAGATAATLRRAR